MPLERLGIVSELLGDLSLERGVSPTIGETGAPQAKTPQVAMIRRGEGRGQSRGDVPGRAGSMLKETYHGRSPIESTAVSGNQFGGVAEVHYLGGGVDRIGWQEDENGTRGRVVSYGPDGRPRGEVTWSDLPPVTDPAGNLTDTESRSVTRGTWRETTTKTTTTSADKVSQVTQLESVSHEKNDDGGTRTTTKEYTTHTNGSTTETSSSITESRCTADGQCTSTVYNNGQKPDYECEASSTDCNPDTGAQAGFRDPDYMVASPSPEIVATVLVLMDSRLNFHDDPSGEPALTVTLPPADPDAIETLVLVAPESHETPLFPDNDNVAVLPGRHPRLRPQPGEPAVPALRSRRVPGVPG